MSGAVVTQKGPASRGAVAAGLAIVVVSLVLAACGTSQSPSAAPACPTVLLLKGAERTAAYRSGSNPRPVDLEHLAVLTDLVSVCRYDEAGVDVALRFKLIVEQGPAYAGGPLQITYFVATLAPDQTVLSKELFDSQVVFPEGTDIAGNSEQMTVHMPDVEAAAGAAYQVYVGFQLDDTEMNRRSETSAD